ncbi:MAG: DUF1513 domain-containing protein [Thiobacillus sp.]|nr:DUF1513 domain-containing protein [Thiobacillus sp.]
MDPTKLAIAQSPLQKEGKGDSSGLAKRDETGNTSQPHSPGERRFDRRAFLATMAALVGAPAWAAAASRESGAAVRLAATWQAGNGYQLGVLEYAEGLAIRSVLDIPTRAHGLLAEPAGTLLAVARRPGDWLLRWNREGRALAWRWIEPRRAFAGHLQASGDGRTVLTTELDLDTGMGLIGVRDAATLEKRDEWPTHGMDPHMLVWDATRPGSLIVANGGVPTLPETGRLKRDLHRMDSFIARMDAATGELLGQWRLDDPRLSLRHMAWNGRRGKPLLGIALQAEHDDAVAKSQAPVLALFDGQVLGALEAPVPLAGYGGSIAPLGDGFAVGCPRSQGVAVFGASGFRTLVSLEEACPIVSAHGQLWAGGRGRLLSLAPDATPAGTGELNGIRLDNHWIAI